MDQPLDLPAEDPPATSDMDLVQRLQLAEMQKSYPYLWVPIEVPMRVDGEDVVTRLCLMCEAGNILVGAMSGAFLRFRFTSDGVFWGHTNSQGDLTSRPGEKIGLIPFDPAGARRTALELCAAGWMTMLSSMWLAASNGQHVQLLLWKIPEIKRFVLWANNFGRVLEIDYGGTQVAIWVNGTQVVNAQISPVKGDGTGPGKYSVN